jgi:large subunit ribosomal protein L40e
MDPAKLQLAKRHRLYYTICRDCGARNPFTATQCRRCRSHNLREKNREMQQV